MKTVHVKSEFSEPPALIYVADFLLDFLFHPSPHTSSPPLKALQIWKLYSHGGLIFLSRPTKSYKSQLSGWISSEVIIKRKVPGWPDKAVHNYYKYFQYKDSELTRIISPVSWSSLVWSDVKQILHYNNVKLPVLLVKTQQGKNPQHHPFKDHKNLL